MQERKPTTGYVLPQIFQLIITNDNQRRALRAGPSVPFAPYAALLKDMRGLRADARRALSWNPNSLPGGGKAGALRP